MNTLGELKNVIEYPRAGFFGNKIKKVYIYKNGIELWLKSEKKQILFSEISSIIATDYFAPVPTTMEVIIKDCENKKIISFMVYAERRPEVTSLLIAHMDSILSEDFPGDILTSRYILDEYLTWDNGVFITQYGKETNKIPLSDVTSYYEENGMPCLKLKNGKSFSVNLLFAKNALLSLEVIRAIGNIVNNNMQDI